MKIFDCFLYNGELDILKLRLDLMGPYVDKVFVVEANQTFSGIAKPMYFEDHISIINKFSSKIEYKPVFNIPDFDSTWEREYFLRDLLRGLSFADDNDLVIIADADEIVNIPYIVRNYSLSEPSIIELPVYSYFINIKSNEVVTKTLITPYKFIKNRFIGNRNKYCNFAFNILRADDKISNGGHFTYLFGYDIDKYINKIKSFSHHEFNTSYFLNRERIKKCLNYNLDVLERWNYKYKIIDFTKTFPEFQKLIYKNSDYNKLIKYKLYQMISNYFICFWDIYYWRMKKYPLLIFLSKIKKLLKQLIVA